MMPLARSSRPRRQQRRPPPAWTLPLTPKSRMLSRLYYAGLSAVRLPALARRLANGSVILCYHNVVRERDITHSEPERESPLSRRACPEPPGWRGDPAVHLPYHRFSAQMRWLTDHYRVVPLREIVRRLAHGLPLRGLAAVTFDDAYQ